MIRVLDLLTGRQGIEKRPATISPFRIVVVKAREASLQKEFVWQIVRDQADGRHSVREVSRQSFKTMEEAYTSGTIALDHYERQFIGPRRVQLSVETKSSQGSLRQPTSSRIYNGWYSDSDARPGLKQH
jgi:hypothetical protein